MRIYHSIYEDYAVSYAGIYEVNQEHIKSNKRAA